MIITPQHTLVFSRAVESAVTMFGRSAELEQSRLNLRAMESQLSHDRDMFGMHTDMVRGFLQALIERRVDAVCNGFRDILGLYAEQSRHYMAQQDKFTDAQIKVTDPLERANISSRLTEIDLHLTRIRRDAATLYREMNRVVVLIGGTMPPIPGGNGGRSAFRPQIDMAGNESDYRFTPWRKRWRAAITIGIILLFMIVMLDSTPNPDEGPVGRFFREVFGSCSIPFFAIFIGHFMSRPIASMHISIADAMEQRAYVRQQERQQRDAQKAVERQIKSYEQESSKLANRDKLSQSKEALIMRLGSIDGFIRVLGFEKDENKRASALHGAHEQMVKLAASIASGEISREAVDDADVRRHAAETSSDFVRLDMAEDRINRDIKRIFNVR